MTSRRVFFLLFLALVGLVATSHTVQAQQEREPWDTDPDSFKSLLEAIENSEAEVRALEQQEVQDIRFVSLEEVRSDLDESQEQRLDQALEDPNTEKLHRVVGQNDTLTTSMEEAREDISVMDVVTIDVRKEGNVVVYYEPVM